MTKNLHYMFCSGWGARASSPAVLGVSSVKWLGSAGVLARSARASRRAHVSKFPRHITNLVAMRFSMHFSPYVYSRRKTREVIVGDPANGGVVLGGDHSIVKQSMLTCDTMDTAACVQQTLDLVAVGCQIVRITAPTVKDAANLKNIVADLRARDCLVPIVADIHFKPDAAMEAAKWVEMVRVNPGNYADKKKFAVREYTDDAYNAELARLEDRIHTACPALQKTWTRHAHRHQSRFAERPDYESLRRHAAGNGGERSGIRANRPQARLPQFQILHEVQQPQGDDRMLSSPGRANCTKAPGPGLELHPIHLGVTEAGEGEDGRIKSAIGIGSLLCDGLGDTIRVSLTEDSPNEIAVCTDLLAQIPLLTTIAAPSGIGTQWPFDPFAFDRRTTPEIPLNDAVKCGGEQTVRVVVTRAAWEKIAPKIRPRANVKPEAVYEDLNVFEIDPTRDFTLNCDTQLVTVKDGTALPPIAAFRLLSAKLKRLGQNNPILLKDCLTFEPVPLEPKIALLRAAVVIGSLLADGIGDAILVRGESGAGQSLLLAFNILQAAGCRSFKTDFVACPSCGRTLFNLQTVTARIKERTQHLKGVKIAIMGCIVNGPGEMADADFGYVGGAPSKINLYVGKTPVKFNVPEAEAVDRLVDLIREHGKWVEPEQVPVPA